MLYNEYEPFAWVYNLHWGEHTLKKFCPVVEALVLPELEPGAHILDVCCGAGHMARRLTDRGFKVTGLDSSEAMLKYAGENAPDASFVLADARAFELPPVYKAAVSTFDSLNHILKNEELTAAFRNVRAALAPGGVLLCDLNTRREFGDGKVGTYIAEKDHVCSVKPTYDDATHLAEWTVTQLRLVGDEWQQSEFHLFQRIYDVEEVVESIHQAGFEDTRSFDAATAPKGVSLPHGATFGRTFFMARNGR